MNTAVVLKGSHAHAPDLDWSQVRETIKMLNLAVAQIALSMREGDESVNTLADSFTSMAEGVRSIEASLANLPEAIGGHIDSMVEERCAELKHKIHAAIVAFQFYDRLTQQLTHASQSLGALGELVCDPSRIYHPAEWHALQKNIRACYTMEEERRMFDALMHGATVEEALRVESPAAERNGRAPQPEGVVELF
jgi:hypothetical protein